MGPDEFFRDSILRHVAEFVEEWAAFEIQIQAVAEAQLLLSLEGVGLSAEGELDGAPALLVAGEHLLADLLGEAEGEEAVLDLFLLGSDVLERVLVLADFHYLYKFIIILICMQCFFIIHILKSNNLLNMRTTAVRALLVTTHKV